MRVQFMHKSELDVVKWNDCVEKSCRPEAYGKIWFLNHIADEWHGLVLDDYAAVMPLVTGRKMSIPYIYQPPFYQRISIYSKINLTKENIDLFYMAIPLKFKLQEFNVDDDSRPGKQFSYEEQIRPNLVLSLEPAYDDLKKSFDKNTKRNIKKAEKNQLRIVKANDPFRMIESYKENRGKVIADLHDEDFERLDKLIKYCVLHNSGDLLEAHTNDGFFAGGIFVLKGYKRHVLLFMGANALSKETGAMFALVNDYLKNNAGRHVLFDFEGSLDEGVARFYSGFGASEEKYFALRKNKLNKLIRFAKRLKE